MEEDVLAEISLPWVVAEDKTVETPEKRFPVDREWLRRRLPRRDALLGPNDPVPRIRVR